MERAKSAEERHRLLLARLATALDVAPRRGMDRANVPGLPEAFDSGIINSEIRMSGSLLLLKVYSSTKGFWKLWG